MIICNSGHVTGATYESLAELFSPHGNLEEIILVPGKSYCFIKYLKVENSLNAFEDCNGIQTLSEAKLPIYLSYVTHIPPQYKKGKNSYSFLIKIVHTYTIVGQKILKNPVQKNSRN